MILENDLFKKSWNPVGALSIYSFDSPAWPDAFSGGSNYLTSVEIYQYIVMATSFGQWHVYLFWYRNAKNIFSFCNMVTITYWALTVCPVQWLLLVMIVAFAWTNVQKLLSWVSLNSS